MGKNWKKNLVGVKRFANKIQCLKLMVAQATINIINVYAPQVGSESTFVRKVFKRLVQGFPQKEKIS